MKNTRRKPCGNCPFRKSAPLAHWDPREYLMLKRNGRTEGDPSRSRTFGCHKDRHASPEEREPCVGWLLYQREHGVPSIALRLILMTGPEARAQFEEAEPDGELYESIDELVRVNLERDRELHPERYEEDE